MTAASLHYLEFDFTEDEHGNGSFDAIAAAAPAQLGALSSEIARVLDWAHAGFGEPRPLDDGGEWDCELQGVREVPTTLHLRHRPRAGLELRDGATGAPRVTLGVTLTGTPPFCAAFRQSFGIE